MWFREYSKVARVMITFENRILAGYERDLHTLCFHKEAKWVDGYPDGNPPDGEVLNRTYGGHEQLLFLTLQDD